MPTGNIEFLAGDRIQAVVVSTRGSIVLTRKGVRNAATQRELEDGFSAGIAVEGKVVGVKGGYEVRIARERAFCRSRKSILPARGSVAASSPGRVYVPCIR